MKRQIKDNAEKKEKIIDRIRIFTPSYPWPKLGFSNLS
jgi:hypothetical protein